jgi:ATP-dependent Clp protease adaptor protein ClpS
MSERAKIMGLKPSSIRSSDPDRVEGSDQGHDSGHDSGHGATGTVVVSKPSSKTKTPPFYRVLLVNDDFTPMDFVIHVLQKFFFKDLTEATKIMLEVHHKGAGQCGVYTYEIAETKVYQVNQYARQNRHPLKCTMELT